MFTLQSFSVFSRDCANKQKLLWSLFDASVPVLPLLLLLLPCRLSLGYWIWLSHVYIYTVYIYILHYVVVCCHVNSGHEDPGSDEGQGALVLFEKLCLSFAQALLGGTGVSEAHHFNLQRCLRLTFGHLPVDVS